MHTYFNKISSCQLTASFCSLLKFFSKQCIFIQSTLCRFIGLLWRRSNSGRGSYKLCVNLEGYEITQRFWPVPSKGFLFTPNFSFIFKNKIDFSLLRTELWPTVLWMPAWKIALFCSSLVILSLPPGEPMLRDMSPQKTP